MKFVDEAAIRVEAGKGGAGCLSFRREKYIPRGGPDGGDGGAGGSIYLIVDEGLNTLVDLRHARLHRAGNGRPGSGRNQVGASAADIRIRTPAGTLVYDADTDELLGDLLKHDDALLVARGGAGGLGNARFKSSVRRAPRKTTPGAAGECRNLRLELQILADVGLLGLPNAGKSTFIRQVSAARPRVADYPFTTLYPHLGVAQINHQQALALADIPGLVQGAAQGVGLGAQFLRHLSRTRLLLHLVDTALYPDTTALVEAVRGIEAELQAWDQQLFDKPRWLVLNKIDIVPAARLAAIQRGLRRRLGQKQPVYCISAITGAGSRRLLSELGARLADMKNTTTGEPSVNHGEHS